MSRYLLVDGNNLMFAAQLGSQTKLMSGDTETTAIFGLLRSLRVLSMKFPGSRVIVLWDTSPTWRHAEFPTYKEGREANPAVSEARESVRKQRPIVKKVLSMMGITQFEATNYEADDLAGYLTRLLNRLTHTVVLVSNDQDWLQLVGPLTSWFDPRENTKHINDATFLTLTGYETPEQFMYGKAMRGDKSDAIGGIPDIGDGAAKAVMEQFGTVEAMWEFMLANFEPSGEPKAIEPEPGKRAKKPVSLLKGTPCSRHAKPLARFAHNVLKSADEEVAGDYEASESQDLLPRDIFARNIRLMNLRDIEVPKGAIIKTPGVLNMPLLRGAFHKLAFLSLAADLENWVSAFERGNA